MQKCCQEMHSGQGSNPRSTQELHHTSTFAQRRHEPFGHHLNKQAYLSSAQTQWKLEPTLKNIIFNLTNVKEGKPPATLPLQRKQCLSCELQPGLRVPPKKRVPTLATWLMTYHLSLITFPMEATMQPRSARNPIDKSNRTSMDAFKPTSSSKTRRRCDDVAKCVRFLSYLGLIASFCTFLRQGGEGPWTKSH